MTPQSLFVIAEALAGFGVLTLAYGLVRFIDGRLRPMPHSLTEPRQAVWSSPFVLITSGLISLCAAAILAFSAFYWGCTRGPDLC